MKVFLTIFIILLISAHSFAANLDANLEEWCTYSPQQKQGLIKALLKAKGISRSKMSPEAVILSMDAMGESLDPAMHNSLKCGDVVDRMLLVADKSR